MKNEILFQLDIVWQLFLYHCGDLSEKEAMWCKTQQGLQIRQTNDTWAPDWPETENYTIGPSSIAWTLWHILYWWNTTLTACRENRIPDKKEVLWPGSAKAAVDEIKRCHDEWVAFITSLDEEDLRSAALCRWPFEGQSLCALALWLNAEFMKNTAEIGAARFLYAARG
ncbi:MAG: DinB family protein [Oscillospiraceae bacterium]|nr:DinB family protein [Oscillospiraceae bacterium]